MREGKRKTLHDFVIDCERFINNLNLLYKDTDARGCLSWCDLFIKNMDELTQIWKEYELDDIPAPNYGEYI